MIIAGRYAEAFLEYAGQAIGFKKALEELLALKAAFHDNPALAEFLGSPVIKFSEKCDVIKRVFGTGLSPEACDFLKLLLRKERIGIIRDIAEYARIKYYHGEETDALLKISYPIDTDLIEKIKNTLEEKLQEKLHLYIDIDPSLLGGACLTVGNTVVDGSVRKRLDDLKDKLLNVRVN